MSLVKAPVPIDSANKWRTMELLEVVANIFQTMLSLGSGSAS